MVVIFVGTGNVDHLLVNDMIAPAAHLGTNHELLSLTYYQMLLATTTSTTIGRATTTTTTIAPSATTTATATTTTTITTTTTTITTTILICIAIPANISAIACVNVAPRWLQIGPGQLRVFGR